MTMLNIRQKTTFRYREPVRLGWHRLMLAAARWSTSTRPTR
mgnify:CR=1 FL=1